VRRKLPLVPRPVLLAEAAEDHPRRQRRLASVAAAPDRADRVDDVARRKPVAARQPRLAGRAAAQGAALGQEPWPGGAVNGAVDTAAAQQGLVGCVDDSASLAQQQGAGGALSSKVRWGMVPMPLAPAPPRRRRGR